MAACDLVTKLCRSLKQFILTLKEILLFFYPKKKEEILLFIQDFIL